MRYRLLDLLACISCSGSLSVEVAESTPADFSDGEGEVFSCSQFCARLNIRNPHVPPQECRICHQIRIVKGILRCGGCGSAYAIDKGIPDLTSPTLQETIRGTAKTYSLIWSKADANRELTGYHYDAMQEAIPEKIVEGRLGLEVGCGSGLDTGILARQNPSVEMVSLDISDGVYKAAQLTGSLKNVHVIKASALSLPLQSGLFDFCYSFGVIHHTPDPEKCLTEMHRVLRRGKKVFLYVYEDHAGNPWKRVPLKMITLARKLTSRLDKRLLYMSCMIMSPLVFMLFTMPSWFLRLMPRTRGLAAEIPFNFGKGPFSLTGDLYDRFGAPIELRFSAESLGALLEKAGFIEKRFSHLKTSAGIVAWGNKR